MSLSVQMSVEQNAVVAAARVRKMARSRLFALQEVGFDISHAFLGRKYLEHFWDARHVGLE